MLAIQERLLTLQTRYEFIKCYALIDGLQYEHCLGEEIKKDERTKPLFYQPEDTGIAFAGPWLKEMTLSPQEDFDILIRLENEAPGVSWLFSEWHYWELFYHLAKHLDIILPDNKIALLRYYDPRVLIQLPHVLTKQHWLTIVSPLHEWRFCVNKKCHTMKPSDH